MRLMGKRILIEQHISSDVTPGGIALPDSTLTGLPRGKVIKIGSDIDTSDDDCSDYGGLRIGDIVQFNELGAMSIELKTGKFVLIDEEDVLLILEDGE